ncbi:MAG: DegT/DnrJ/EryC1/StrS family aminotransferase [Rhodobacteraceae bacterium]|nr:DegT/DnrJ/EryC1/StrS family aminotransferase [Paracoccaceae bacterium]MCP5375863.1 DegT/DnrJ/EryC1/StrS family aminotransferase [Paracoccaceae bacterium]
MTRPPVYVTRPILPPLEDVYSLLQEIWQTRILSNGGPILQRFEAALGQYLGVDHISMVGNASMGLVLALRHHGITGEVITPAFSFVATSHAIRWAGAEPVFADIDPVTLNLDPVEVEKRITSRTQAILAVHCYGTPCDTDGLQRVADRHGLRLIYDAAHAFGVRENGRSICTSGDLSVLSFHATKVFNTFEGGAIISPDRETKLAIDRLGNYGIVDETTVLETGLNTKMSELNAAVGLALLPQMDSAIATRARLANHYSDALGDVPGLRAVCPPGRAGHNYYHFPILVGDGYPISRDALYERLRQDGLFARRYFYPLISDLPMYRDLPSAAPSMLPVARRAANQVLCLPIFPDLDPVDQERIIGIVRQPC